MKNFRTSKIISALVATSFLCVSGARAVEPELLDPVWSFDAKKLAYLVINFEKGADGENKILSSEIWAANRDGSDARRLTKGRIDGDARWSPDGKQVAFRNNGDIWMVNADGTSLRQITKTETDESSAEFSNDGKVLYFVRVEKVNASAGIKGARPILVPMPGQVIAYSLVAKTETERFKSRDNVVLIMPNRTDANEVFLLHHLFDAKAEKNGAFTQVALSAVRLDGKGRRILKTEPERYGPSIQAIRSSAEGTLVRQKKQEGSGTELILLDKTGAVKAFNNGKKSLEPLLAFGDISRDGLCITGVGPAYVTYGEEEDLERTIRIYDLAADEMISVPKRFLLGKSQPTPVAVPITTPPAASKPIVKPAAAQSVKTEPLKTEPPAAAKKYLDAGNALIAQTFYGSAIDEYSKAIELHPQYAEAFYGRGLCYVKRYEGSDALPDLDAAIRLNPNHVEAHLQRAIAHLILGDNAASLADLNTAVRLAPDSARVYSERSAFYYATGDTEKGKTDDLKAKSLEKN